MHDATVLEDEVDDTYIHTYIHTYYIHRQTETSTHTHTHSRAHLRQKTHAHAHTINALLQSKYLIVVKHKLKAYDALYQK